MFPLAISLHSIVPEFSFGPAGSLGLGDFLRGIDWTILAVMAAIFDSSVHLNTKTALKSLDVYVVSISMCLIAALFAFIILTLDGFWQSDGLWSLSYNYFFLVAVVSVIASVGTIFFVTALKHSEVSLAIPLLCFSPLFACFWSAVFLGEYPSAVGLFGVIIVIIGAYTIELKSFRLGFMAPITSLFSQKGPRYVFFATLCWSFTAVLDKQGSQEGSPLLWTFSICFGLGFTMLVFGLLSGRLKISEFKNAARPAVFVLGLSYASMHMCQMTGLLSGQVPYVLSIKRLAILFSVVLGALLFREQQLRRRLLSSLLMIFGVVLIAFYS
jgi:uncharacterized membrane protein